MPISSYVGEHCDVECPISEGGDTCDNHGKCILSADGLSSECTCEKGFYGPACENSCPGLQILDDSVLECSGHGTYNTENFKCVCEAGVKNTETCSMEDCSEETCINGSCVDGVCKCNSNYYGANCSTFCDMHTTCHSHGVCDSDGECLCTYGWADSFCNVSCTSAQNCSSHGVCDSNGDCMCFNGFSGTFCDARSEDYSLLVLFLLLCNAVVGYLWYRSRVASMALLHE